MFSIRNEILDAVNEFNIKFEEIFPNEALIINNNMVKKYVADKRHSFLWEGFTKSYSIQNSNAWMWIKKLISKEKTIMFFSPRDEKYAFAFFSGEDITKVLGNTCGYEFFLTNENFDYVLCFNHHDYLIGCGSIIEPMEKMNMENGG